MAKNRTELKVRALFENPQFLLLYVPPRDQGGPREKMRLVRPVADLKFQEPLIHSFRRRQYYVLSHVWGIPDGQQQLHLWPEIGDHVDDENGNPVAPIPMRYEKRQTLLALLDERPGYWWIDVLCARVETPLVIMGDIYTYCDICYAMIDCPPHILESLSDKGERRQMKQGYSMILNEEDNDTKAALFGSFVEKWSGQLQLIHLLAQCKWWKRVWTWQEATLPRTTYLFSETSGTVRTENLVWIRELTELTLWIQLDDSNISEKLEKEIVQTARIISSPLREISEAWTHRVNIGLGAQPSLEQWVKAVMALGDSTRTCMDPVDYVYGVLGMLDLDVPRMEDHRQVWQHFLAKLEEFIQELLKNDAERKGPGHERIASVSVSPKAYDVDLATAASMADVYSGLLNVTFQDNFEADGKSKSDPEAGPESEPERESMDHIKGCSPKREKTLISCHCVLC